MTEIGIGSVVRSECGYGAGRYYAVVGITGKFARIADGTRVSVSSPKKKNVGHLTVFKEKIDVALLTDEDVAARLRQFETTKKIGG